MRRPLACGVLDRVSTTVDFQTLHARARAQAGMVSRRQALATGLNSRRIATRVRQGRWQRVTRGVYALTGERPMLDPPTYARLRAAWVGLLATDPDGIAPGQCALALHGAWGLPVHLPAEIVLPHGQHRPGAPGVRVRRFSAPMRTVDVAGRRVADPVTALIQALPEWDRDTAVSVLDSALNRSLISRDDLRAIRRGVRGRRGAARLHEWWRLVDPAADSPLETRARLQCHDAGLAEPTLQVRLRDEAGVVIARGDLGWQRSDGSWVLAELDGLDVHSRPEAVFRDRRRQNAIVISGPHTLLRFTGEDVARCQVAPVVRAALHRPSANATTGAVLLN